MIGDALGHRLVVTAEDGVAEGGVGSLIAAALRRAARPGHAPATVTCGTPLEYLAHGRPAEVLASLRLDGPGLYDTVLDALPHHTA